MSGDFISLDDMNEAAANVLCLLGFTLLMAVGGVPPKKVTVYLIGDSTMAEKAVRAHPETGWGTPFQHFFDSTVVVDNRAKNGRSTRTFIEEGRWQAVVDSLRAGDYVLIQFAHNDEVPTKQSYTTEAGFKANLATFITDARSKQATPILLTPVARRRFDEAGRVVDTHPVYAQLTRDVAAAYDVPLIDVDEKSRALLAQLGVEQSTYLFNHLSPGEHPNYPEGVEDNTHFNEYGARRIAELVLAEIRALNLDLAERIVKR